MTHVEDGLDSLGKRAETEPEDEPRGEILPATAQRALRLRGALVVETSGMPDRETR